MTIKELFAWARPIDQQECRVILSVLIKKSPEWVISHPERIMSMTVTQHFKKLIPQRKNGTPLAYLIGTKEFYGFSFLVKKGYTLIPRPETEQLVETVLKEFSIFNFQFSNIVDVGTGSGCIAITLAKLLPRARVMATDISKHALTIARKNAHILGVAKRIKFIQTNLLPANIMPDIIVANLPYLTTAEWRALPLHIKNFEPRGAFDGGHDGNKYYRMLFQQIKKLGTPPHTIVLEIDPRRSQKLKQLAQTQFPRTSLQIKKDLAGHVRVLIIKYVKGARFSNAEFR